jgi:hypothetical protein
MSGPAPACPRCGSTDLVPISYGYPTAEAGEAEKRGYASGLFP